MKKVIGLLVVLVIALFTCPANADCDKVEAQNIIKSVVQGGLAEREVSHFTTYYHWKTGWYTIPYEQQYKLISGLAGVEQCLREGPVTTRIRFLGRDVAKGGPKGIEIMHSRP